MRALVRQMQHLGTSLCIVILIAGCGGGGGGGGSSNAAAQGNVLFAPDIGRTSMIGAFSTLNPSPGQLQGSLLTVSDRTGTNVQYDSARDLLYTAQGALNAQKMIAVFGNASKATGSISPVRTWNLPADVVTVDKIVLDTASDTLYVGGHRTYDNRIYVYSGASTLSGTPTPTHTFTPASGLIDFAVDVNRGLVYYTGNFPYGIYGISVSTGTERHVACNGCVPSGVAIDARNDRLYAANGTDEIHVIANASLAQPADIAQLSVANPLFLTFDPTNDRLYVSAYTRVFILNSVGAIGTSGSISSATAVSVNGAISIGGFGIP